jgi:hypothetical protein
MFHENYSGVSFSERLTSWLPGAFSLALLAFSLIANPLFIGGRQIQMPWYLGMLLIGTLGMTVHVVLRRQRRKLRELEEAIGRMAAAGVR